MRESTKKRCVNCGAYHRLEGPRGTPYEKQVAYVSCVPLPFGMTFKSLIKRLHLAGLLSDIPDDHP